MGSGVREGVTLGDGDALALGSGVVVTQVTTRLGVGLESATALGVGSEWIVIPSAVNPSFIVDPSANATV